ncbi:hypothetical protein WJX77_005880 [Trebouxia sp. C0004]
MGNESRALIDLNTADLLCPHVDTFTWRAYIKSDVGDYQGALEDFDRAALLQLPNEHSKLGAQTVRLLSIVSPDGATLNEAVVDKADPQEVSADLLALAIAWHKRGKYAGVLTVIDAIPLPECVPDVAGMANCVASVYLNLESCSCQVPRVPSNQCRGSSHFGMDGRLKAGSAIQL